MTQTVQIGGAYKGGFRGSSIIAYNAGRSQYWVLRHEFTSRDSAKLGETLEKIRAAGRINLANWRSPRKGEY